MSIEPISISCPVCKGNGNIKRYVPMNHCKNYFQINDICEKCGGSGRVTL